ncbi:MFS transporter [Pseudoclavibacter sp. VKM Ac-2867]|uniref:MFS transporter n=1 Tax=Pseudoclavibacter sp. VKM Ac-2867 TaxID=2783829 RepID=UPI00188CBCB0|nr:MFS transporter [Pseudoclavibacter sp. VKM Ac-2867]MBF4460498.1 MFS transporter [Pseudoclavibacter sp. VKM Ac-2867]
MLFSTVPLGMFPVAVVITVHAWTGSFAIAGWTSAAFTCGTAVGLVGQGYLIDRVGPRKTITAAAATFLIAVLALVLSGRSASSSTAALLIAALVAGVSLPEVTTAVRVWLARSSLGPRERVASYSLLGACFQTGLVFGPLLVSMFVLVASPDVIILMIGSIGVLGAGYFLRIARRDSVITASDRSRGPLKWQHGPMLSILTVAVATGVVGGVLILAIPRVAEANGSIDASGFLFAALAIGEVVGAVAYGAVRWSVPPSVQLMSALAFTGVMLTLSALTLENLWLFGLLLLCIGAAAGPIAVLLASATENAADAGSIGRASGLRISVSLAASAAGSAFAGGTSAALTAPAVLLILALVLAVSAALPLFARRVYV